MNQEKEDIKQFIRDHFLQENPKSYYEDKVRVFWNGKPGPGYGQCVVFINNLGRVFFEMMDANQLNVEDAARIANGLEMFMDALWNFCPPSRKDTSQALS
jgi:hypothetical protein